MTIPSINQVRDQLHEGVCIVTFAKTNGSTRVMKCTLNENTLFTQQLTPTGGHNSGPENQIRVVDVDCMQWRSFRHDSILKFEGPENEDEIPEWIHNLDEE